MNFHDHGANLDGLTTNVIPFPGVHRGRLASITETRHPSALRNTQPAAVTAAELNARLLILLGICTTSAALALSAVHILQG